VNLEVNRFRERVDRLIHGTADLGAPELRRLRRLLESMAPDVREAIATESIDRDLRAELDVYAENLKALDASLQQVRCVMLSRQAHMAAANCHVSGMRGWLNAYRQTAP
jgi:uncharacterized protein with von Willebrand factor type A (vWA) domain